METACLQIKFTPLLKNCFKKESKCCLEIVPEVTCIQYLDKIEWEQKRNFVEYTIPMTYKVIIRKQEAVKEKWHDFEKIYHSCVDLLTPSSATCFNVDADDLTRIISDTFILSNWPDLNNDEFCIKNALNNINDFQYEQMHNAYIEKPESLSNVLDIIFDSPELKDNANTSQANIVDTTNGENTSVKVEDSFIDAFQFCRDITNEFNKAASSLTKFRLCMDTENKLKKVNNYLTKFQYKDTEAEFQKTTNSISEDHAYEDNRSKSQTLSDYIRKIQINKNTATEFEQGGNPISELQMNEDDGMGLQITCNSRCRLESNKETATEFEKETKNNKKNLLYKDVGTEYEKLNPQNPHINKFRLSKNIGTESDETGTCIDNNNCSKEDSLRKLSFTPICSIDTKERARCRKFNFLAWDSIVYHMFEPQKLLNSTLRINNSFLGNCTKKIPTKHIRFRNVDPVVSPLKCKRDPPEVRVAKFVKKMDTEIMPLKLMLLDILQKCATLGLTNNKKCFDNPMLFQDNNNKEVKYCGTEKQTKCNRVVYSVVFDGVMDNEAIVDQIVRSLSFEVVAVPQDIIEVNSTSKSTPLSVKIRVRKKTDAEFRHGVLSMPKVERKEKMPERIRLVSSDRTIMSFNVLMDADFDEIPSKDQKQNLKMVTPGLRVQDDIDNYPAKSKKVDTSPILSKKNKDIFGRCKPGGCLDPPFGEDKYSYQPHQNLMLPIKDDSSKLRTSSIFKNKLFKRKKKTSQDDELYKNDTKTSTEPDSILSIYEKGSLQSTTTYSNSIITYPHPSNSSDLRTPEKSSKTRYSSEDKARSSVIEDNGSYFIIPRKTKNQSKQFDSVNTSQMENIKFTDDSPKPEIKNILRTMPAPYDNLKASQTEINESNHASEISNFIPIPLLIVTKDDKKDPKTVTENIIPSTKKYDEAEIKTKEHTHLTIPNDNIMPMTEAHHRHSLQKYSLDSNTETVPDETSTSTLPVIRSLNYTNDIADHSSPEGNKIYALKKDDDLTTMRESITNEPFTRTGDIVHQKSISDPEIEKQSLQQGHVTESTLLHKIQDHENGKSDINLAKLSTTKQEVIPTTIKYIDTIMDDKSSLEISTECREDITEDDGMGKIPIKSLLVTDRDKSLLDVTSTETATQSSSDLSNLSDKRNSTEDLQHIWKNDTQPLKSAADVITMSSMPTYEENPISTLEDTLEQQKYDRLLQSTSKSVHDYFQPLEKQIKQRDKEILREAILVSESETRAVNILGQNIDDIKSPDIIDNHDTSDDIDYTSNGNDLTKVNVIPSNVNNLKLAHSTNSGELAEISENLADTNDNKKEQHIIIDYTDDDDMMISDTQENLEVNALLTSFTEDEVVTKDLDKPEPKENSTKLILKNLEMLSTTSFTEDEVTDKSIDSPEHKENDATKSTLNNELFESSQGNDIPSYKDNELFTTNLDGNIAKMGNIEYMLDKPESTTGRPDSSIDRAKLELATQYQDIDDAMKSYLGVEKFDGNDFSQALLPPQPTTTLRQRVINVPWKMNIGLQSYTDENNERVIKSFDSDNVPERRKNDAVVVAQCSLEGTSNEIKIPIDHGYNLCVQIKCNASENRSVSDLNVNVECGKDELHVKRKIHITLPESDAEDRYYKDVNTSKANKHKTTNHDIRDVLVTIYEKELVPLQEIIKGLREEIDMLAAYEMKFREKAAQKLGPKKSKPIRLVHGNKKCACIKRL